MNRLSSERDGDPPTKDGNDGDDLRAQLRCLAERVALLEATLDATPDGILVTDLDGRLLLRNRRFGAIWGFPEEMFERYSVRELAQFSMEQVRDRAAFMRCTEASRRMPAVETFHTFELNDGRTF